VRKNAISIDLNDKAKAVYDGLPREVRKGEWVSHAIIEFDGKAEPFTEEQKQWIRTEIASFLSGN